MSRLIFGLSNILQMNGKILNNYHNLGGIICAKAVKKYDCKIAFQTDQFTLFRNNMTYVLIGHEGMNNSGHTLQKALKYIDATEILLVHDEIDIVKGRVKVQKSSGRSTHNGLRNIFSTLNRSTIQIRIGIGPSDIDVCSFVLKDIKKSEQACFDAVTDFVVNYIFHTSIDMKDLFVDCSIKPSLVTSYNEYKKRINT